MKIINDDSRVINKLEISLTDDARVIIYDRHMFVQATEYGKNCPSFEKVAKTVAKPEIAKISTPKLYLKVQNIYIKPLLKPKNSSNKPYFETNSVVRNPFGP